MSKTSAEQPSKRVKVTLACTICRKKKVKCNGVQPTCSRCQSIGICCQYSDPPKKRGPPKGYVEVIENRAHRIESILGNQPALTQQIQHHDSVISSVNRADDTSAQLIKKPTNTFFCLVAGAVDHELHGSHGMISTMIINDSDAAIWTESFFSHFNFILPILSKPQFNFQLARNELNPVLKLAVLLLGCRLNNNTKDTTQEKILYRQCVDASHDIYQKPDLCTVQILVIMSWYAYLAGDMKTSDSLRHLLASTIRTLSLGQELIPSQQDMYQIEMRRRAFWVSYVIDQWLASCMGGDRLLFDSDWDAKYPQMEDNQLFALSHRHEHTEVFSVSHSYLSVESALQINSFLEMIRLAKIVGDICDGVMTQASLESNLTGWLLQLPSYLDYGKLNEDALPSPIARMYRILYYTVQIMLNKRYSNCNRELSTSICTTASNTVVHISEQMLEQGHAKYLHNIFFLSLTLATSIHLENAITNGKNNAPDKINLCKSISLIKEVNCSLLPRANFDSLIDCFLVDHCAIVLDFVYPSPSNSASLTSVAVTNKQVKINANNKRVYQEEEEDYHEERSSLHYNLSSSPLLYSPISVTTPPADSIGYAVKPVNTTTTTTTTVILEYPTLDSQSENFDITDIFPILNEQLIDTNQYQQGLQQSWMTFVDNSSLDASKTCSPASYFTPSHSPLLSIYFKDEDAMSFDDILLSDQQFFAGFPLV